MINSLYFSSTITEKQKDYFNKDLKEQRYLNYISNYERNFTELSIAESDEKLFFSDTIKKISFNEKSGFYVKIQGKRGFSLDKKKNKVSLWFGSSISSFHVNFELIFNSLGLEWVTLELYKLIRKGSFEKILSKKITNPKELVKYYLNTSQKFKKLNLSHKKYYNIVRKINDEKMGLLNMGIKVAKNGNHFLDFYEKEIMNGKKISNFVDIIRQGLVLDKKIDFMWSKKRILRTHNDWSVELMKYNADKLSNYKINYNFNVKDFKIPLEGKLILTEKELFIEGETMKHCVYTNYWEKVKRKEYFIISLDKPKRITVGISYNNANNNMYVSQIYGISNSNVDKNIKNIFEKWVENKSTQKFFMKNYKKNNLTDSINVDVNHMFEDVLPY